MRNAFNRNFYGTYFKNASGSTIIKGELRINSFVKTFLIVWSAILALFMFISFFLVVYNPIPKSIDVSENLRLLLIFPAMFVIEILMLIIGLMLSKNNEKYVIEFIEKELMATKIK